MERDIGSHHNTTKQRFSKMKTVNYYAKPCNTIRPSRSLCYYHRQGIDRIFSSAAKFHSVVYLPFCHPNTPYTHAHLSLFCFFKAVCFAQATFLYRLQELWSDASVSEMLGTNQCPAVRFKFMPMGIPHVVLRTSSRLPLYCTVAALCWSRNDFCVCNTLSIYCFPIRSPQHRVQIFSPDKQPYTW